jgi:hypothetical protein
MERSLLPVLIVTGFAFGCNKDFGGTNPSPLVEDWSFPASATRDTTTLYCDKESVVVGESFDVKVVLYNVSDLFGAAVEVDYVPAYVDVVSVLPGPLFPADSVVALPPKIEPAHNRVSYGVSRLRGSTGLTGSGVLMKLKCKGRSAGVAGFAVNPANLEIRNRNDSLLVRPIANLVVVVR